MSDGHDTVLCIPSNPTVLPCGRIPARLRSFCRFRPFGPQDPSGLVFQFAPSKVRLRPRTANKTGIRHRRHRHHRSRHHRPTATVTAIAIVPLPGASQPASLPLPPPPPVKYQLLVVRISDLIFLPVDSYRGGGGATAVVRMLWAGVPPRYCKRRLSGIPLPLWPAAVVDDDDDSEPDFDAVLRAAEKDERGDECIDTVDFDEVSDNDSEGEAAAALLGQLRK
eukprot:gene23213-biopygen5811